MCGVGRRGVDFCRGDAAAVVGRTGGATVRLCAQRTVCLVADAVLAPDVGYLPSADKSVITKPHTTLEAIEKILDRLEVGGRLAIMIYYGHDGGDMEKDAVLEYVIGLDQRDFTAMLYQPLNQINTPPFLVMLEKLQ